LAKKGKAVTPRRAERDAVFHPEFRDDLRYWVEVDRQVALRAFDLIEAILRDPFRGIGKPEPLKYLAAGTWSRRLTQEHRMVYLVSADWIDFLQARYHYYVPPHRSLKLTRADAPRSLARRRGAH